MLLTLDIGNTNIKSALFDDNSLNEFTVHPNIDNLINYLEKILSLKQRFVQLTRQ